MLEEDYLAMTKNQRQLLRQPGGMSLKGPCPQADCQAIEPMNVKASQGKRLFDEPTMGSLGSQIVREIVIPELTREVNEGKNFANLRQITNSLILAAWFKRELKASVLARLYVDQKKMNGVNLDDQTVSERIYQQYLQAYKKGVYNYIKEEADPVTGEIVPRKYFSGGYKFDPSKVTTDSSFDPAQFSGEDHDRAVTVKLDNIKNSDKALLAVDDYNTVKSIVGMDPEDSAKIQEVFKPLVQLLLERLGEFGPVRTAAQQEAFGEKYEHEVQTWLFQNRVTIENVIKLLPSVESFLRYKRNLIFSLDIPNLGAINLFIHDSQKGPRDHFHGNAPEDEKEMAFVAALTPGLKEIRYPNVTHYPSQVWAQLEHHLITDLVPFKVATVVDETYGAHRIEGNGKFVEVYLSPISIIGFDSLIRVGNPNATKAIIIRSGSSLYAQHVNSLAAVAKSEKWQTVEAKNYQLLLKEVLDSLHPQSVNPFIVFRIENSEGEPYAIDDDPNEITKAFIIQPDEIVLRGGPQEKYILIVKRSIFDEAMVSTRLATPDEILDPKLKFRIADGIIKIGQFKFPRFFFKKLDVFVVGVGSAGMATAAHLIPQKDRDGRPLKVGAAGNVGESVSDGLMPNNPEWRGNADRNSILQNGLTDPQFADLVMAENKLPFYRKLGASGRKLVTKSNKKSFCECC